MNDKKRLDNMLKAARIHVDQHRYHAARRDILAALTACTSMANDKITELWWYPKIFDDDRSHWDKIQKADMYRWYFINGVQIAWRYYRLEIDYDD